METKQQRRRSKRNIRKIASGPLVAISKQVAGGDRDLAFLATVANKIYSHTLYSDEARKNYGPMLVRKARAAGSLRELSRECGLSSAYLSLIERGEVVISPASFMLLTRFCGIKAEASNA